MRFRELNRFKNIKSFFHFSSSLQSPLSTIKFYKKMKSIASILKNNFRSIVISIITISIDKIIMRFTNCEQKQIYDYNKKQTVFC